MVSIVVPAYNAQDYVAETIESLLAQTYKDLEIIVINDGSKDGTQKILEKYSDRVQVLQHENQGQAHTLNKGWAMAKGDLIGYLSADDIFYPDCIAELVAHLKTKPELVGVYPDYDLIDAKSRKLKAIFAPEYSLTDLFFRGICAPGPGALFKKGAYLKTGGWNPNFRQIPDYDFWLRLSAHGPMERLSKSLAGFRVHPESQSFRAPTFEKSEEIVICLNNAWANPQIHEKYGSLKKNESLATAHLLALRSHLKAYRLSASLEHLRKALELSLKRSFSFQSFRWILSGLFSRPYYSLRFWLNRL